MAKALESFTIARSSDGYLIRIEDEDGDVMELTASFDQLDLITAELDRQLDSDEEEELTADDDDEDASDD